MKPLLVTDDPDRGDQDSASRADLVDKCRGRFALIKDLRARGELFEEESTEEAEVGTLIHIRLCGVDVELPAARARRTYEMCRKLRDRIVDQFTGGKVVIPDVGAPEERQEEGRYQVILEKRLWYRVGLAKLFSGQADLIILDLEECRALIVDYKSGLLEVEAPARNKQLRALTVLLKHNSPELLSIEVEVLQPWVSWAPHPAEYTIENFAEAEKEIVHIYSEALFDVRRTPGAHCARCEARAQCATAIRYVSETNTLVRDIEEGRILLPAGAEGDVTLDKIETVEKILKAVKAKYKAELIKNADFLPGRRIAEGNRSIKSVPAAWQIVKNVLTRAQFDGACSVLVTDLEEILSDELSWNYKTKRQQFNEMFADVLQVGEQRMLKLSAKEKKARAAQRQLQEETA
jgi:hypothetical protein